MHARKHTLKTTPTECVVIAKKCRLIGMKFNKNRQLTVDRQTGEPKRQPIFIEIHLDPLKIGYFSLFESSHMTSYAVLDSVQCEHMINHEFH